MSYDNIGMIGPVNLGAQEVLNSAWDGLSDAANFIADCAAIVFAKLGELLGELLQGAWHIGERGVEAFASLPLSAQVGTIAVLAAAAGVIYAYRAGHLQEAYASMQHRYEEWQQGRQPELQAAPGADRSQVVEEGGPTELSSGKAHASEDGDASSSVSLRPTTDPKHLADPTGSGDEE